MSDDVAIGARVRLCRPRRHQPRLGVAKNQKDVSLLRSGFSVILDKALFVNAKATKYQ
jgi:hypothetical protein